MSLRNEHLKNIAENFEEGDVVVILDKNAISALLSTSRATTAFVERREANLPVNTQDVSILTAVSKNVNVLMKVIAEQNPTTIAKATESLKQKCQMCHKNRTRKLNATDELQALIAFLHNLE